MLSFLKKVFNNLFSVSSVQTVPQNKNFAQKTAVAPPETDPALLEYKLIYYSKYVSYHEAIDYVMRFGFSEDSIKNKIDEFIQKGYLKTLVGIDNIAILKLTELKDICRKYSLPVSGKKNDLILKLKSHLSPSELELYIPKDKYLIRTESGNSFYKALIQKRNELEQQRYLAALKSTQKHNCTQYNYIRDILGVERANKAITDLNFHKHNPDSLYVFNTYDLFRYKNESVKYYEILTEKNCCDLCKKYSGQKLPVSNAKMGVNFPPFHDECRCCTVSIDD